MGDARRSPGRGHDPVGRRRLSFPTRRSPGDPTIVLRAPSVTLSHRGRLGGAVGISSAGRHESRKSLTPRLASHDRPAPEQRRCIDREVDVRRHARRRSDRTNRIRRRADNGDRSVRRTHGTDRRRTPVTAGLRRSQRPSTLPPALARVRRRPGGSALHRVGGCQLRRRRGGPAHGASLRGRGRATPAAPVAAGRGDHRHPRPVDGPPCADCHGGSQRRPGGPPLGRPQSVAEPHPLVERPPRQGTRHANAHTAADGPGGTDTRRLTVVPGPAALARGDARRARRPTRRWLSRRPRQPAAAAPYRRRAGSCSAWCWRCWPACSS